MVLRSEKRGFGDTTLSLNPYNSNPSIEDLISQTLSRMLGWSITEERWREVAVDVDGRILVSTSPTKASNANVSLVSVGVTSTSVLGQNSNRKQYLIQNTDTVDVFISFGGAAVLTTGIKLEPNAIISDDIFTGEINAIVASGTAELRVVEFD